MKNEYLISQIHKKKSFLCVGLDTDLEKIPSHLLQEEDPIFAFNKAIIDATHEYCVAYKPNIAFYEAYGLDGWKSLERTMAYLNENHPEIFTIADAKRGDIGNTSTRYAKAFFETLNFDSITIAPYMGKDSVEPFLEFEDKHTILLALTSNQGAFDFQTKKIEGHELYKEVLSVSKTYKGSERLMYVVGATKATYLKDIRELIPESFLLVPGVGAQGGSLEEVCKYGITKDVGLLVNSSRGILYASTDMDFAEVAGNKAKEIQQQMAAELAKL
ncbi:orotidine-5'-phosphate decarboxylase [Flagellimonas zhangzhouensis]|uniref:Orotidine 5'-phosphate decarboxylase n=1 Tax=Flagellimonas zhangzhouensis TaxID=1073328 RepID=A0A1H2QRN6_9FLAO|nr:orotidine-5'-phosphate decarboxylase [Allomuricauda zhangzhouensis]SDQ55610.1 orotidine-5'-phosphate decarboxylase [Allomuricauda zhangzhouensis]SDW09264.1 orotidine-5'-phosphate decarboxylase [Allomuricauda zhangzhouensis]